MRSIGKIAGSDRGSEIAEAALVLPLAFLILLGIYWFGRAFNTYATINHAAREGARAAIVHTSATSGNAPPAGAAIANIIVQDMQASGLDPTKIISSPITPTPPLCGPTGGCPPTPNNITFCGSVQLQTPPANGGPAACGVMIRFQYPYQFLIPFTSLQNQTITLTADVQMVQQN